MLKAITVILLCILSGNCFSQIQSQPDSSKSKGAIVYPIKETNKKDIKPAVSIYPNPAKNKITVQVSNYSPGLANVKVLNINGGLVREDKRLLTTGTEDIIMFLMLKAGTYFIQVSGQGKVARKKMVIL